MFYLLIFYFLVTTINKILGEFYSRLYRRTKMQFDMHITTGGRAGPVNQTHMLQSADKTAWASGICPGKTDGLVVGADIWQRVGLNGEKNYVSCLWQTHVCSCADRPSMAGTGAYRLCLLCSAGV